MEKIHRTKDGAIYFKINRKTQLGMILKKKWGREQVSGEGLIYS